MAVGTWWKQWPKITAKSFTLHPSHSYYDDASVAEPTPGGAPIDVLAFAQFATTNTNLALLTHKRSLWDTLIGRQVFAFGGREFIVKRGRATHGPNIVYYFGGIRFTR